MSRRENESAFAEPIRRTALACRILALLVHGPRPEASNRGWAEALGKKSGGVSSELTRMRKFGLIEGDVSNLVATDKGVRLEREASGSGSAYTYTPRASTKRVVHHVFHDVAASRQASAVPVPTFQEAALLISAGDYENVRNAIATLADFLERMRTAPSPTEMLKSTIESLTTWTRSPATLAAHDQAISRVSSAPTTTVAEAPKAKKPKRPRTTKTSAPRRAPRRASTGDRRALAKASEGTGIRSPGEELETDDDDPDADAPLARFPDDSLMDGTDRPPPSSERDDDEERLAIPDPPPPPPVRPRSSVHAGFDVLSKAKDADGERVVLSSHAELADALRAFRSHPDAWNVRSIVSGNLMTQGKPKGVMPKESPW